MYFAACKQLQFKIPLVLQLALDRNRITLPNPLLKNRICSPEA